MQNKMYIVDDLSKFIESTRVLVFNNFGKTEDEFDPLSFLMDELEKTELEELNQTLTQAECEVMAMSFLKKQKHRKTQKIRYLISRNKYMEMIETFNSRLVSNMLNTLVNKGVLESAYDIEENDFVFWVKEDETKEKPETD